jgi:hypothetical protein
MTNPTYTWTIYTHEGHESIVGTYEEPDSVESSASKFFASIMLDLAPGDELEVCRVQ